MKEILMMIIKMIDEGKITADEGVRLIAAVKSTGYQNYEAMKMAKKKVKTGVDNFVKNAEPKVKDAAQKIKEKTEKVADNISKGINDIKDNINEKKAAAAAEEAAEEAEVTNNKPLVDFDIDLPEDTDSIDNDAVSQSHNTADPETDNN